MTQNVQHRNANRVVQRSRPQAFRLAWLTLAILLCAGAVPSLAQDAPELAKKAQNPVAHLISVPFQNNFNFGSGPEEDLQYVLNLQPVIPFRLTKDWNLITRTIAPLIQQPKLGPGIGDKFGLGDIQNSLFLSPAKPGKVIWGIGPVFGLPTATERILGTGKFSIGPSVVALTTQGPWVIGTLVNNLTSVAGKSDRQEVNQMLIQPFVNYNMRGGWYFTSSPIYTANWEADGDDRWTAPVGGGVGKIFRIGKQPVNVQIQAFNNVKHPDNSAKWSLRFQFQLLFPKH
jgi:hypothetical protein